MATAALTGAALSSTRGSKKKSEGQQSSFVDQQQAPFLQQLYEGASGLAGQQLGQGSQFQNNIVNPATQAFNNFLTPQQNPFLQGQVQQGQQIINDNLQQNILPSIGDSAASTGQFGGGRQGVAEGIALSDANQQSANFAQNIYAQDYQQQQNRAIQALGQAGNIGNLGFQPLQNLKSIIGNPNNLSQGSTSSKSSSGGISG